MRELIEPLVNALFHSIAPRTCLCDWTVTWAPDVQASLGMRGGFHQTAHVLLLVEVALGLLCMAALAAGRWRSALMLVGVALAAPFPLFMGLFGVARGQHVLAAGGSELILICTFVLLPSLLLGGIGRGVWLLVRPKARPGPVASGGVT